MANFVWFLSLLVISFILVLFTYKKKDDFRKNLALYFLMAGLSFTFDFFILVLWQAYTYYPLILKDRWADDILGSVFSQGFFIPSVLMTIAAFQIKTRWVIFIILGIAMIEELFIFMGLYEHNWWQTIYTMAFLFAASFFVKWWRRLLDKPSQFVRLATLYMLFTVILRIAMFFIAVVMKFYWFSVGWFTSENIDHIVFEISFLSIFTLLLTVMVEHSFNFKSIIFLFFVDVCLLWLMFKIGILFVGVIIIIPVHAILLVVILLSVYRIHRYFFPDRASGFS